MWSEACEYRTHCRAAPRCRCRRRSRMSRQRDRQKGYPDRIGPAAAGRDRQRGRPRPVQLGGTAVTETAPEMKCRRNRRPVRASMLRALSFSAAASLILNPALAPVVASDCRAAVPVADGQMNARFLALGIGKSIVIDLPRDIKDV